MLQSNVDYEKTEASPGFERGTLYFTSDGLGGLTFSLANQLQLYFNTYFIAD